MKNAASIEIYEKGGGDVDRSARYSVAEVVRDAGVETADFKLFRRLIRVLNQLSCTKVIASHDLDFVYDTCQRVVLLADKGIAAIGTPEEVLRNQALLEEHGLELPLSFSR